MLNPKLAGEIVSEIKKVSNKPVTVKIEKGQLYVSVDVKVKYGANVNATAELLQNKIYENILFMTGFKASDVAVNVEGFEI